MPDGFIKAATCSPDLRVADCAFNLTQLLRHVDEAHRAGVQLLVFPELSLTGYTCGDLFFHQTLISGAWKALEQLARATQGRDLVVVAGLPAAASGRLYNCAAVLEGGAIRGLVSKEHLTPGEARWFAPAPEAPLPLFQGDTACLLGGRQIFSSPAFPGLALGVEICNDLWVADPPSSLLCAHGATVVANLAASPEAPGKSALRQTVVRAHSLKNRCAYLFAGAGPRESTTDAVFGGHQLVAECGAIIAEAPPFSPPALLMADIDLEAIAFARHSEPRLAPPRAAPGLGWSALTLAPRPAPLTRAYCTLPFVCETGAGQEGEWRHILDIQAYGLRGRLAHTGSQKAVLGISGGLDSTLALLVACRAFELAGLDSSGILAYTLPCFGTTDRTKSNAYKLCPALGVELREIDISAAVRQHFTDIQQPEGVFDAAFENAQARERTQVLMDIANQRGGLLIGTGDLSELALGWATYNGDHMSMYGVNGGVPKTLIRHMLGQLAQSTPNAPLAQVLRDILDTPVSPELLPAKDGRIAQKTEDLVGPYTLHDFFIFHALARGAGPRRLYALACHAFAGEYEATAIKKWLEVFFRRFFSQQFKRSCMPDGAGVGLVSLSPRGGLAMPSDAAWSLWRQELESLRA